MKQYLARLLGTRPDWPNDMTSNEERIMGEHFVYLRDLTLKKKVLMAGPHFQPVFGLIILQVADEAEARQIMNSEPSVTQGVHTYELSEMRVSLFAHMMPQQRYADNPSDRVLVKEIVLPVSVEKVWQLWTTAEGVKSFIAEDARIELRPGGPYEWYFSLEAPEGTRGSEDCKLLSYLPMKMLSFEWNAPADFGPLRDRRTQIILMFESLSGERTRLTLSEHGWGTTDEWEKLYQYFDRAWEVVFEYLAKRCASMR